MQFRKKISIVSWEKETGLHTTFLPKRLQIQAETLRAGTFTAAHLIRQNWAATQNGTGSTHNIFYEHF